MLYFLSFIYLTLILFSNLVIDRFTFTPIGIYSSGGYILLSFFTLQSIMAESYGIKKMISIIINTSLMILLFGFLANLTNNSNFHIPLDGISNEKKYKYILDVIYDSSLISFLPILISPLIDTFFINALRLVKYCKTYIIRALLGCAFSQLFFSIYTIFFALDDKATIMEKIIYISHSYPEKMIIISILIFITSPITTLIKKIDCKAYQNFRNPIKK